MKVVKVLLVVLLVLLLLLVVLPIGMGHMDDCPACTSKAPFALGICAGILSLLALGVLLSSTRFRLATEARHRFLLTRSIYRPPRLV